MDKNNTEDMFLYEDDLNNDEENEELKRDIPDDADELEEMFNELIKEEEIDDEESDDLDEIEDAEEEDNVKIIDSDDPEYHQPLILDKDDVIDDDTANNDVNENYLFNEDKEEDDEEKNQPGYSELRAKFLDSHMLVPTSFGPQSTYSVNTSGASGSDSSVSDGGMSTANGTGSVGGAVTEQYLYEKDPKPEFTFVDLKNAILDTDAEVGYTIGTPETEEVKNQTKDIVANENYVDEENKTLPFIKVSEDYDTAIVKSFNGEAEKINENILNTFKLESASRKQIFVTNESIETMRRLLLETGKIKNDQQLCEDCGSKLSLNESNEIVCENCQNIANEEIKQEKEVGEVICNECGIQEQVDPNVNENELVCENCGSDDIEFKTRLINEYDVNEEFSPKDLVRYVAAIAESLNERVDIVLTKESYNKNDELPSIYNASSLLVDKVDFGKGFKKVVVVAPKGNKLLKELYTNDEISIDSLKEEFNQQLIQRVTNESVNGLLENYLNPLDEVDSIVKESLNDNEVDLEQLEESINAEMKNKDDILYEGHEESLEEFYEDIVFEGYENVPNKDEEKFKKVLSENINDLNTGKEIKVNESSLMVDGKSFLFEGKNEKELKELLMNEDRLEQNLLNGNIFKIINI